MARVPEVITCVDCGGSAHLISRLDYDEDPPQPGDVVVYRCSLCLDRWDLVLTEEDTTDEDGGGDARGG